ncbi:receptor-type tyrosine-protein phosphatase zeta-like isoform X2 [Syngnathoides biaculeatus]|uniref:receptor-type tyrosine-protein phosphatase zeta-like isoform X2 n=1 Tax=Syngnathoides biaculeatus TaxID=300417 RepID=UPI002ADD6123|nr:receptor-type tyrosine-protein phosphatase zeta-like isoform X2 [Syngnathoides biaculeatus]
MDARLLHILLTLQQVGGYTYRNQRKFSEDIDWSYTAGTLNQHNWAKKFPACGNAKQSPIDVEESLAQVKLEYQNLRLDGWENVTGRRSAIKNDGKTVAVDVDGDFYVSGGGLGSTFKAGRITFHWGRCNASSEGSEHSLDGVKYPLEMQIYCYQPQRFESFDRTVEAGGPIAALAVLFEASSEEEDNADFAPIADAVDGVSRYGKSGRVAPFAPRGLLPDSTDKYFVYNGSLTTPPCSETVEWIVFKNTVRISARQLEVFCEVMTMEQAGYVMLMDYLQNNYRERQRQFVGPVFSSYTGTEELLTPVCSSEPENLEAASYNRTGLLLTWERPRAVYDSAIERYAVSYEMADAEDAAPSEYLTDGDQDVGAILDDLVANSSYAVRVAAVCANGLYGRVSDPATFTVPADGPENSLIPDSDDFDYAEANYPPDPFSNESVQREDSDQARIPTTSPATSTSGPLRRPLQKPTGATETETQSTTVSATSSQGATSGPPAEVATGFPSTTPLYANASDRAGRVGPKSSESNEVDRTASTATGSDVWMEGGKSVSSSGTTTSSTTNKTRPMTTNQILFTNQVPNSTTKMTANTTADKTVTRPMTETTATNVTTRNTTETLQVTTYRTTEKPTTSPTDKITTTKTTTNESTTAAPTITTNMTTRKTTIETTTVTVTTAGGANTNVNKETRDKSASGPLNATTPTTGTKNTSPNVAHLGDGLIAASSVHLLSAAETEVRRDDAMQVQGELFPELPSPSAAVVSLSEGERVSVPPPSLQREPRPVPSGRLHELPLSSTVAARQFPAPPTSLPAPSLANDLASFSSGQVPEREASLPDVSPALGPTLSSVPLPRRGPALSFAGDLASFSSGEPIRASPSEASPPLSPTLRLSVLLSSDFPHSAATPVLTPSFSNEVDLLGHGTGSAPDSFPSEDGADDFPDGMCGCSLEPSASWPHVSSRVPLGGVASISGGGGELLASSLGVLVSSLSGATSGGPVVTRRSSPPAPGFRSAAYVAPPRSVAAAASEPTSSQLPPSVPVTHSSADRSNGVSGYDVDQEGDGVRASVSGENPFPRSTLESGQTPDALDDRSSAFYFDGESGSAAGSGRAGAAPLRVSAVPSPAPAEESGSGQAENLYDNDTSSDFSIPERTQRESRKEEDPVADVSNSSHESRVGSDGDGRRKAAVPLAVISALTALGLALLVGVLLYWRMCFRTAHFYVDEGASPRVAATPAFTPDEKSALPVGDFVKHVAELHRTCGFRRKFEEVRTCAAMTSDRPDDDGGQKRYGHVPPGDRSRARLSAVDEDAGDDIDANLVDGFKMRHAYIAAQGPSKSSTDRFWRMIWEQNVGVVVMIGDLLEKGRKKCHQYWPADVREDYGGLAVTLESVQERAHYTRRTFAISETHVKKGSRRGRGPERAVTQYHYTRWPDGGVPEDALPLIGFIRETRRARTTEVGPVVVHCSAGVGRTGAYLVLDGMLRQIRLEDAVDVDGFLRRICTQTNCLVQTQEQYVFIHDALAEAISCGDTEVAASRLGAYVERLLTPREDGKTPLDRQLELLSAGAADPANDDLREDRSGGPPSPAERSRVRLSPCAADESGYINASYVTGHERIKEFIITQNPLPGTVKDFWSMIWDQNSGVIVSLPGPALAQDGEDEDRGAEPRVFWPAEGQPMSWERLSVTLTGEDVVRLANGDALNVHRLAVCAAQDDFLLDVRLYRAPRWPNPDGATSDALLLLELLRREEETSPEDGPLVVLDRAGGVTAGTFCALSSLIGQLHGQGRVDVFRVARTTALCRPGTFRTRDQLEFLYKALLSVLDKQQQEEDRPDDDDDDDERTTGAARSLESLV